MCDLHSMGAAAFRVHTASNSRHRERWLQMWLVELAGKYDNSQERGELPDEEDDRAPSALTLTFLEFHVPVIILNEAGETAQELSQ